MKEGRLCFPFTQHTFLELQFVGSTHSLRMNGELSGKISEPHHSKYCMLICFYITQSIKAAESLSQFSAKHMQPIGIGGIDIGRFKKLLNFVKTNHFLLIVSIFPHVSLSLHAGQLSGLRPLVTKEIGLQHSFPSCESHHGRCNRN